MHRLIRSCPALQTKQSKQAKGESGGRHELMHNISQVALVSHLSQTRSSVTHQRNYRRNHHLQAIQKQKMPIQSRHTLYIGGEEQW